jgi:hypothetical protein
MIVIILGVVFSLSRSALKINALEKNLKRVARRREIPRSHTPIIHTMGKKDLAVTPSLPRGPDHFPREDTMNPLVIRLLRSSRILPLVLILLAVPTATVHAQFFGYGYGYGVPAYGYGYGYPGFGYPGYGYGYPGFAAGYGYPPYGSGFGYYGPGVGVGSFYGPGFGFGGYGYGYGFGSFNPYFGVGLTPLGVDSALTERYIRGGGTSGYSSSYGTVPDSGAVNPGTRIYRP